MVEQLALNETVVGSNPTGRTMNYKNIFLWALYDFANSIVTIVFFLYFSQWLVVDKGVPDIWFNLIFAGSSILLLCTAPILGSISDKMGTQMKFLRITTLTLFFFYLVTSLIVVLSPQLIILAALLYLFVNYLYQLSFSFYNPLLHQLAPSHLRGWVSGIGQFANWTGQIAGLLISLPIISGDFVLFGEPGRTQIFIPATLLFFVLALPMLLGFKEKQLGESQKEQTPNIKKEFKDYKKSFLDLWTVPGLGIFLVGFFFFNDATLTAANNFPIYLEKVFGIADKTKALLMIGVLATSALGALVGGKMGDKIGLKRSLIWILGIWLVVMPLLAGVKDFRIFTILTTILGMLYGATWTVTRAVMTYLAPPQKLTYSFSFYTLAERFATFVGPVSWGLVVSLLPGLGADRYRLAMLLMTGFILIGLIIVRNIPKEPSI